MRYLFAIILITTSVIAFGGGREALKDLPEPIRVTFSCKTEVRDVCYAFGFSSKVPGCK